MIFFSLCRLDRADNYSRIHPFFPCSSCVASLALHLPPLRHPLPPQSHRPHLRAPTVPAPEPCRAIHWSPSCGASLGGSLWILRARSPRLTDAWALWTWWPSVWAALWGQGSTSCQERWPGTLRGPVLSSPSSLLPWRPYSQDYAMQSLGHGFLKRARRIFTATWPWESCWPSSLDGICCFLTS